MIDTHDASALATANLRTRGVRALLAGAAVALLVAAAASARQAEPLVDPLLPQGSTGVVVLDLSLSIADEDYTIVRRTLRRLVAEETPVGLVVFSDVPYELLPPGTPAAELRSLLRLLVPPELGPPVNPWSQTFRAGTRISTALELAKAVLERDAVDAGSILLVSDLETAPDDVPALARTVRSLRQSSIALRIVPLAPSSDALLIFEGLVDAEAFPAPTAPAPEDDSSVTVPTTRRVPTWILLFGALSFLFLAAHERFAARLALPRAPRAGGAL